MDTVTAHLSRRCRPLRASAPLVLAVTFALVSVGAALPAEGRPSSRAGASHLHQTRVVARGASVRPSYSWPVKPFRRQHPVRAYLNDPRNGDGHGKSFHFGIDISAADGTPVYAVAAGYAFITRGHSAVAVVGGTRTFGYWHVVPAVRHHQRVRVHQLLGYVAHHAGHVHFAEKDRRTGAYLNPLRPGGIGPYVDRTPPTIVSVEFLHHGHEVPADALTGRVDIVAEAFDTTPLRVTQPAAWSDMPVTPARIRWSIVAGSRRVTAVRTAADFRHSMLPPRLYDRIYAPGTHQNFPRDPGHYRFFLARSFDVSRLPAGSCRVRIEAVDTRGNLALAQVEIARDPVAR
jgi:hypothetical protein